MIINGEEHNDLCVGIDLGTTNSVLATINVRPNKNIVSRVVDLPRAVDISFRARKCLLCLPAYTTMKKKDMRRW